MNEEDKKILELAIKYQRILPTLGSGEALYMAKKAHQEPQLHQGITKHLIQIYHEMRNLSMNEKLSEIEIEVYKLLEDNIRLDADYRRGLQARLKLEDNREKVRGLIEKYREESMRY